MTILPFFRKLEFSWVLHLGYARFYRRFIKDFSKIERPLCSLLEKDAKFEFDEACRSAFEEIKARSIIAPIMVAPD